MKSFDAKSADSGPAWPGAEPIDIEVRGVEMVAEPPTAGQFALYLRRVSSGGVKALRAQFDFLVTLLSEESVDELEKMLDDGMEFTIFDEIVAFLLEEWTQRPTEPSSAASGSPKSTGKRSTAKAR